MNKDHFEALYSYCDVDDPVLRTQHLLAGISSKLKVHSGNEAISEFIADLAAIRRAVDRHQWLSEIVPCARKHEAFQLLMECPFTSHAFKRPRGYPGDAALLDFIYQHDAASDVILHTSPHGLSILRQASQIGASKAVRSRREIIARKVTEEAQRNDGLRVLSLACGHLREFELLDDVLRNSIAEYTAVDQDPMSLASVATYGGCVRPVNISVRQILADQCKLGKYHFIYSAGLYDYLDQPTSRRLTKALFEMLQPGGKLLIANFLKDIVEQAYMEIFMRWDLTYRCEAEIRLFEADITMEQVEEVIYFEDATKHIGYVEISKII